MTKRASGVSSGILVHEDYRFRVVQAIEKKGRSKSGNMSQIQLEPSDVETSKPRLNSLFLRNNSLILKIFSPLICVGNCARSRCRRAVSCYGIPPETPKIAIFPVKFPVSREFAWRPVRSALRRQPPTKDRALGDCGLFRRRDRGHRRRCGLWRPPAPALSIKNAVAAVMRPTILRLLRGERARSLVPPRSEAESWVIAHFESICSYPVGGMR